MTDKMYPTANGEMISKAEALKLSNMNEEEFDVAEKISGAIASVIGHSRLDTALAISLSASADQMFHVLWHDEAGPDPDDLAEVEKEFGVNAVVAKVIVRWVHATVVAMIEEVRRGRLSEATARAMTHEFSDATKRVLADTIGAVSSHA